MTRSHRFRSAWAAVPSRSCADPRRTPRAGISTHDRSGRPAGHGGQHDRAHFAGFRLRPRRRIAVVTCMDSRIDVFSLFGLGLGDVHILRNAGGRVTDDMLRSLALSSKVLGTDSVVIMQHTGCGLEGTSNEELRARTGADLDFLPIDDHGAALRTTPRPSRERAPFEHPLGRRPALRHRYRCRDDCIAGNARPEQRGWPWPVSPGEARRRAPRTLRRRCALWSAERVMYSAATFSTRSPGPLGPRQWRPISDVGRTRSEPNPRSTMSPQVNTKRQPRRLPILNALVASLALALPVLGALAVAPGAPVRPPTPDNVAQPVASATPGPSARPAA